MSPIACRQCGNTSGPFVPGTGLCEDCEIARETTVQDNAS